MKALLYKDLVYMRNSAMKILLVIIIYGIIFIKGPYMLFVSISSLMVGINVISTFGYDKTNSWERFILCTPIDKKDIVISKFLLVDTVVVVSAVVTYLITLLVLKRNITANDLITIFWFCTTYICFFNILIPFIFKFGAEALSYITAIVFGGAFLMFMFIYKVLPKEFKEHISKLAVANPIFVIVVFLSITIVVTIISMKIAVKILNSKEY